MGLGMARPGAVISSLPEVPGDELDQDEIDQEGAEGLDDQFEDNDDPANADAQAEGYADAAERTAMEAEAHAQGWRPLEQYRGKPGGWVNAKTFIERGKNYLPFVQKELRESKETIGRMSGEMEQLRTLVASTQKDMQQLLDFSRRANQAGYDRAVKDLKEQQREAVTAGDVATFDKIEGQLEQMAEAREEGAEEPAPRTPAREAAPQPQPAIGIPQEYQDFMAENPWFNTDRVLNSAMIAEHNAIIEEAPGMPLYEQLEKAKEAVVARFPKKFGVDAPAPQQQQQQPRRPAAPLPPRGHGGRQPVPRGGEDPIESLTDPRERADARAGYLSAKKSMPNLTKAEYMEIFSNPHGDVLDTISRNKPRK